VNVAVFAANVHLNEPLPLPPLLNQLKHFSTTKTDYLFWYPLPLKYR
jgi:hypothetical protein